MGDTFDIHTGGEDLIFPHNEDEIAQSQGASGKKFANYWVHGGYLLVDDEKMSPSKGNIYTLSDLKKHGFEPLAFRYLTLMTHYKSKMNFTLEALAGAQTALNHLREIALGFDNPKIGCAEYEERFLKAINDDLDMPKALSIVWELVKSDYPDSAKAQSLFKFDKVLGLDLERSKELLKKKEDPIPDEILKLVKEREVAIKLTQQAQSLARVKSEYLANMAHEFRTLINAILGFTDILKRGPLAAKQKDHVDTIILSGNLLLGIVNNILDFSKLEAGKLKLDVTEFDLFLLF